jgi:hypothetical protein
MNMAKVYRTAMGKAVDIDGLRLVNEHVIAVGNMKVNARGDELGPGGKVVKTRDQIMKDYYALNTPVATDTIEHSPRAPVKKAAPIPQKQVEPEAISVPIILDPNSGMDEIDVAPPEPTGPVGPVMAPVAPTAPTVPGAPEVAPVATPAPAFIPKTIDPGQPVTPSAPIASATDASVGMPVKPETVAPAIRGSLASAVAKTTTVTQTAKPSAKKAGGIQRF